MDATRREFIAKTGGGLAAILAAGRCPAYIRRSIVGAKCMNAEKPGPDYSDATAIDYVQDGLIAQWDGIENAGYGIHDPAASTWVDLAGTFPFPITINDSCVWTGNSLLNDSSSTFSCTRRIREYTYPWLLENGIFGTVDGTTIPFIGEFTHELVCAMNENSIVTPMSLVLQWGIAIFEYTFSKPWSSPRIIFCPANDFYSTRQYRGALINGRFDTPINYSGTAHREYFDLCNLCSNGSFVSKSTEFTYRDSIDDRYSSGIYIPAYAQIHSIRFYNRVLTDAERQQNYLIDKARFGV